VILVTGATGTVGREVVAQLLVAGEKVRALTRNPSRARLDEQVELVAGDLNQPETLAKAVEGVERIFSLALGPELGTQEASLAQAAKKAGGSAHRETFRAPPRRRSPKRPRNLAPG
jgi:uncharacterized protein YbjT (DUF2867 family)